MWKISHNKQIVRVEYSQNVGSHFLSGWIIFTLTAVHALELFEAIENGIDADITNQISVKGDQLLIETDTTVAECLMSIPLKHFPQYKLEAAAKEAQQ